MIQIKTHIFFAIIIFNTISIIYLLYSVIEYSFMHTVQGSKLKLKQREVEKNNKII